MDIKSMLVKLAEEQADKMQEQAMEHLASDDMAEKIASAINKRIDIPFVSEADVFNSPPPLMRTIFTSKYASTSLHLTMGACVCNHVMERLSFLN